MQLRLEFYAALAVASMWQVPGSGGNSLLCEEPAASWQSFFSLDNGICVYTQQPGSRGSYDFSQTISTCAAATKKANLARPLRVQNPIKKSFLAKFLLENAIGYFKAWTEARCNATSSKFEWSDGSVVADTDASCSPGQRMYFEIVLSPELSAEVIHVATSDTAQRFVPVCEYDAPRCDPETVSGYNRTRMRLSPQPLINQTVTFECAPGFFRQPSVVQAADADRNRFWCEQQPGPASSLRFKALSNSIVDSCKPVHCLGSKLLNATVPDAESDFKKLVSPTREYGFGEKVPVRCKPGFVHYADDTKVNSSFECGQNDLEPSLGMWLPPSLVVCFAMKCKQAMPFYDDKMLFAYKAYDRVKDRTYTSVETNRFPYYPNVVSLRCRQDGFFFVDRKYDKALQCDLPGNGTNNIGVWKAVEGTVLSKDVMRCQQITCRTNEIVIASQQNDLLRYLQNSHFNDTLVVTDQNGGVSNMTIKEFTELAELGFNYKVKFFCNAEHDMSATNPDTGKLESVAKYEVTCSTSGTWNSKVSACIKRTASLVTEGSKKYVPPAKEAEGAGSLGVVVIIILVVFFSTIIVLDLTTITRDIGLMQKNIRRIRLRLRQGKKPQ